MQAEGGGQENEAAEETEFFERIFREAALKKGRGTRQAAKEGGLWRNIRRRWERFMGGFQVAVEIGGNTD